MAYNLLVCVFFRYFYSPMITLDVNGSSGHIITHDFIGDLLMRCNKMNVSHFCLIYLPIFQGYSSELPGLMFYAFNGSPRRCSFDVLFCLQRDRISRYLNRKKKVGRGKMTRHSHKIQAYEIKINGLLRAASNRDVNNGVSSQKKNGRDETVQFQHVNSFR